MLRIGVFGAVYWTLIVLIIGSLENRCNVRLFRLLYEALMGFVLLLVGK